MKVKESKGILLIVFIITLAVLVVVAMGVIVYLLNNPKIIEKTTAIGTQSSVQSIQNGINNESALEEVEITNDNIFDNEYKSLNELALLKISSSKLTKKEEIYEYDFNKDGINEKITLKQKEDEYFYSIYYENQEISDSSNGFNIYVVDLDESDEYLDLILSEISMGGGRTDYYIYKNNGTALEKLKYTTEKMITADSEGNNFCLDKKNNFILLGDIEASLDKIVTNTYYSVKNNIVYNIKIENPKLNNTYKVKEEHLNFTKDLNRANIQYKNEFLEVGSELQIIEWIEGPERQEIIKVKLDSGEIGYIYEDYA